ncbi:hypothetical protein FB107DRAFT_245148 [Schizophyllum commune]
MSRDVDVVAATMVENRKLNGDGDGDMGRRANGNARVLRNKKDIRLSPAPSLATMATVVVEGVAAGLTAARLFGPVCQAVRRRSVKAQLKKDLALVNDIYKLLNEHGEVIDPEELEKILNAADRSREQCNMLVPLSGKFSKNWSPSNMMTARQVTKHCKRVLEQCHRASNEGIELKIRRMIDGSNSRTEVSLFITRRGSGSPNASSTMINPESEPTARSQNSVPASQVSDGTNSDNVDDFIMWFDEPSGGHGVSMTPSVQTSTLPTPPTLIHVAAPHHRDGLAGQEQAAGLSSGGSNTVMSNAGSARQRWHVVRCLREQVMNDGMGLNFDNAWSVSSFMVIDGHVEELTDGAAFTGPQLTVLVQGSPRAEQFLEVGLSQPLRGLLRQMTTMSLVSMSTGPAESATGTEDSAAGFDVPFDGQDSLLA